MNPTLGPAFGEIFEAVVNFLPTLIVVAKKIIGFLAGISIPLSIFFFIVIIYCVEGLKRVRNKESEIHEAKVVPAFEPTPAGDQVLARKWESVKKHIASDNESDWRQAIMDADIILDDLLNKMGYRGESVGEKLKRVVKGDFETLDDAWAAHKVRNDIAHRGTEFRLDHHDAKEAFDHYRKVFEEFYYI